MTLSEFKAWFEGYTDGMGDQPPNAKQWGAIKAKVGKITGTPITYPIYVERYHPGYWNGATWITNPVWVGGSHVGHGVSNNVAGIQTSGYAYISPDTKGENVTREFDSHAAMYALGTAEAQLQ